MDSEGLGEDKKLTFPLPWQYRIVAEAEAPGLEEALRSVFAAGGIPEAVITPTQASSTGKYQSYSVHVEFQSEAQMRALDAALAVVPGVKFIL